MDTQSLYALRDVAGVPTHPVVFLVLGVVTFALHIFAVQVMLGASGLTIWGALSADDNKRRLAQAMLGVAKVAVSVAVVIGVAPLLFVQVIYDPFWYTSNVLSAWWVIGFIVILTIAYLLMYFFYAKNHHLAKQKTVCPGSMVLSILLLLSVGFIMHVLTQQMLSPDQWMQWYAPEGKIDARGTGLHDYNLFRFGFFISLSILVIGGWLLGYRQYISQRADVSTDYLDWLKPLGQKLSLAGGLISLLLGALWMNSLPESQSAFASSAFVWVAVAALLLATLLPLRVRGVESPVAAYITLGFMLVTVLLIAIAREALRWSVLNGNFGYNALDYTINPDWYSTGLFFTTFLLIGGTTLGYLLTVAWKSGQSEGVYTPSSAISKLGNLSIALIVLWIIHFFALGFWVWLR